MHSLTQTVGTDFEVRHIMDAKHRRNNEMKELCRAQGKGNAAVADTAVLSKSGDF